MKGILLHFLLSGKVNLCLGYGFSQVHLLGFFRIIALGENDKQHVERGNSFSKKSDGK